MGIVSLINSPKKGSCENFLSDFQNDSTHNSPEMTVEMENCYDDNDKNFRCANVFSQTSCCWAHDPFKLTISDLEKDFVADQVIESMAVSSAHALKERQVSKVHLTAVEKGSKRETKESRENTLEEMKSLEDNTCGSNFLEAELIKDFISNSVLPVFNSAVPTDTQLKNSEIIACEYFPSQQQSLSHIVKLEPCSNCTSNDFGRISFKELNIDDYIKFVSMTAHYDTRFFYNKPSQEVTPANPRQEPLDEIFPNLEESEIFACIGEFYMDFLA